MEVKKNPKLYHKMLHIAQWYKQDKLSALKTGIIQEHPFLEFFDIHIFYELWHKDTIIYGK